MKRKIDVILSIPFYALGWIYEFSASSFAAGRRAYLDWYME